MRDVSEVPINGSHDSVDQDRSESTPLYANVIDTGTLRLIVAFFFGFSVTVTIALGVQLYYGTSEIQRHGSVVSDCQLCSQIGVAILQRGGNSVDAAVAVAFCMGVVDPHLTGIGSGGYMLIYDQRERKVLDTIDFRVTRHGNGSVAGIPGFVAGMFLAHQLHGVLSWEQVVAPAEYMARNGFPVTHGFKDSKYYLYHDDDQPYSSYNQDLFELLDNSQVDTVITNLNLANTLSFLATSNPMEFYTNKSMLLADLKQFEANFGHYEEDTAEVIEYKAVRSTTVKGSFLQYDIIVPSHGSGGPLLLENLKRVNETLSPLVSAVNAFADTARNWSVSSASHIAVADINDIYVTMVSGLGSVLGSQFLTPSGYIMNNAMDVTQDKSSLRPLALLTPAIVLESRKVCGRRLLLGGGDVRDVAQALIYLLRNSTADIGDSIEAPRVRILTPYLQTEDPNHHLSLNDSSILKNEDFVFEEAAPVYPSINVIQKVNDTMTAHADSRGLGLGVTF